MVYLVYQYHYIVKFTCHHRLLFFSSWEILLAGNLQYTDFVLLEENVQCHCPSFMLFVDVVYVCVCVCMLLKGAVIGDSKFCS